MENQEQERREEPSEGETRVPLPGREEIVQAFPDPGREEQIEKGL